MMLSRSVAVLVALAALALVARECRQQSRPVTRGACDQAGGIWDAEHGVCHDDDSAPRAMDWYGIPDRPPKSK